jgi:predicted DNA-binding protein
MTRFAPITADILARKGDARPWNAAQEEPPPALPVQRSLQPVAECTRLEVATPSANLVAQLRKCTVRVSQHDYERLGILAARRGKTRHNLLQEAIGQLFTGMTDEFRTSCQCLAAVAQDQN